MNMLATALHGAQLVLYQTANDWGNASPARKWSGSARSKYLATEAALLATSKAIQIVGGRSAHKGYPLERLFRDVRTSALMPINADKALEMIGKDEVGVEDKLLMEKDLASVQPG